MFSGPWIGGVVALAILSVVFHSAPLFLLVVAGLLVMAAVRVWERYCLHGVEYRRRLSSDRAFFGDVVDLDLEVINRKILPLAWLEIEDEIPRDLAPSRGRIGASFRVGRSRLVNVLTLRPFERVRRRFRIPCAQRGEHVFGPVRLQSGDLFGFLRRQEDRDLYQRLVVYPKVLPVYQLGLPPRQPLGDVRRRSWIFEDPAWTTGVRDYTPRDGMRRIHWASTARLQRLQVKVYDATTDHQVALFVNLHTAGPSWWWLGYDHDALEMLAVTAASLAHWATVEGLAIGLYVNGQARDAGTPICLPPSTDPTRYQQILEALARVQPFAKLPVEQLVAQQTTRLWFGTTVVILTARIDDAILGAGRLVRRRGHVPVVVVVGERPSASDVDGITIRFVPGADVWRSLTALDFQEAARDPIPVGGNL